MKKPTIKKLYIDEDGVERGFYVYLHKNKLTNETFYVGMGCGRRAWEKKNRSQAWQEKVASFGNDWIVEILKEDLSEIEAFQLEHDTVIEYGGPSRSGGTLTNIVHGGDQPLAVTFSIQISDLGWGEAYHAARRFCVVSRTEQEQLVKAFLAEIDSTEGALRDLDEEGSENGDDFLAESAGAIADVIGNVIDDGYNFLKRKISWKDFCMGVETADDGLAIENPSARHGRVRPLLEFVIGKIRTLLQEVDSGNRVEAEAYAERIAKENATVLQKS